jgi:hypothetical protein
VVQFGKLAMFKPRSCGCGCTREDPSRAIAVMRHPYAHMSQIRGIVHRVVSQAARERFNQGECAGLVSCGNGSSVVVETIVYKRQQSTVAVIMPGLTGARPVSRSDPLEILPETSIAAIEAHVRRLALLQQCAKCTKQAFEDKAPDHGPIDPGLLEIYAWYARGVKAAVDAERLTWLATLQAHNRCMGDTGPQVLSDVVTDSDTGVDRLRCDSSFACSAANSCSRARLLPC